MLGKSSVTPVDGVDTLCSNPLATSEPNSPSQSNSSSNDNSTRRQPKRVLHFSDGIIEEFSSDDEVDGDELTKTNVNESQVATINPSTLDWIPWVVYQSSSAAHKALAVCDYLGEHLANFFGILSPKYEYELEQYKKILAEERDRCAKDVEYGAGWTASPTSQNIVSTEMKTTNSVA